MSAKVGPILVLILLWMWVATPASDGQSGGSQSSPLLKAKLLIRLHKYPEAESYLRNSLKQAQEAGDFETVETCLDTLAENYDKQGQYEKAADTLKVLIAVREKRLWPEHPFVAQSRRKLWKIYSDHGKNALAEPLIKADLERDEKALGKNAPQTMEDQYYLGMVAFGLGRHQQAEGLWEDLLARQRKIYNIDSPVVDMTRRFLGNVYYLEGKYSKMELLRKESLQTTMSEWSKKGGDPFNLAGDMHDLARAYYMEGKYSDAEPLLERGIALMKESPRWPNEASQIPFQLLARIKEKNEDYRTASKLMKEAIEIIKRNYINPKQLEVLIPPAMEFTERMDREISKANQQTKLNTAQSKGKSR